MLGLEGVADVLQEDEAEDNVLVLGGRLHNALAAMKIPEAERRRRGIVVHSWRRWFNTMLRSGGVEDSKIRALTGHKTPAITDRYTSFGDEHFKDALAVAAGRIQRRARLLWKGRSGVSAIATMRVAMHEAAHAVVFYSRGLQIRSVTIDKKPLSEEDDALGLTTLVENDESIWKSIAESMALGFLCIFVPREDARRQKWRAIGMRLGLISIGLYTTILESLAIKG